MTIPALVTVVETPEFISRTRKLLTNAEREELVVHLARNPSAATSFQARAAFANCGGALSAGESAEA